LADATQKAGLTAEAHLGFVGAGLQGVGRR
jgi:hypothetical protein